MATVVACNRGQDGAATATTTGAPPSTGVDRAPRSADAPSSPLVLAPRDGIRWMPAPAGVIDAATVIHDAAAKERTDRRTLLVYVGATWCEPCQRFHHAVEQGELDVAFPRLTVLAFDADRDSEALASAGYASRLIPLFALPNEKGRASGKQIEGSVKGADAVSEITPRLRQLVLGGS